MQDIKGTVLKFGGADNLEVVVPDQVCRLLVTGAVEDKCTTESGNAVSTVGLVVGISQGRSVCCTARVVMLEDDCCRTVHQVLDDVEAVIHVGQVDLARMLAHLQHVINGYGRNQAAAGPDETAVSPAPGCR